MSKAEQLVFERREGIFKAICRDARSAKDRKFFLLIDEINRGDIPRIFGELLTLLERDKRGMEVNLPVSGERFSVPPNVFVLGTMNTADRSIALLDTALRRRFGFLELMPDASKLAGASVGGRIPLGPWLTALNERIRAHCGRDARNLQVGHAYFLEDERPVESFSKFARIVAEDVIPLLEEYCYEDYGTLKNILGDGLVDEPHQRIRDELFAPAQQEKLVQALSAISPEMSTSLQAAKEAAAPADADEAPEPDEAEK
jgi:5-methylcytosine-specific restriction protein B